MTESVSLPSDYQVYEYDDPFEDHVGPLGYKVVDGTITFAFLADARHRNTAGTVHGGMLMTFADFALCLTCLLYTSPSPRDGLLSRMPSSA